MGFNRFGLGFGRRSGSGLPQITVISGGVLSRSGSTVTWEPWTYSVSGLDTNTVTFVLDGVDQAPGAITFPYTLAAGHTLGARGSATKAGYSPASPVADLVLNPAAIDIADENWSVTEALADADTRKTYVRVIGVNRVNFELHAVRGSIANLTTATPALAFLSAGSRLTDDGIGGLIWTSGGLTALGQVQNARLVEVELIAGVPDYATGRWCSTIDSFTASNIPITPAGVAISTGSTAGAINVSVSTDGDGRGRGILALYATINGGAPFALTPSGGAAGVRTFTAVGTEPVSISVFWRNANGDSAATAAVSVTPGIAPPSDPDVVTYSETFSGGSYVATSGGQPIFRTTAAADLFPWGTSSAATITQNAALTPLFPTGQSTGALVFTRGGAVPDTQNYAAVLEITDPTREYRHVFRGAFDNIAGATATGVFKVEYYNAANALLLTTYTASVAGTVDVAINYDRTEFPPAGAAWIAFYVDDIRTSRANLHVHDLFQERKAFAAAPVTPTAANFTVTDPYLYPGATANLNYIATVDSYTKPVLGIEYAIDYGAGPGLWAVAEGTALGVYPLAVTPLDSFTLHIRVRNELGYSGTYITPSLTTGYAAPTLVNQDVPFGALTLAGGGGVKPLDSNKQEVSITSYDSLVGGSLGAYTPVVTAGVLTFTGAAGAPNGAILRCTVAGFGSRDLTVLTEANTYSVRTDADFVSTLAVGSATLANKTIKGRPTRIRWPATAMDSKNYGIGTPLTITSHVPENRMTLWEDTDRTWRDPENITLYRINVQGLSNPASGFASTNALFTFLGIIRNLSIIECDLDGGIRESNRIYGNGAGKGWRGVFGSAAVLVYGLFELKDCTIHDSWRGINFPPTSAGGIRRAIGNKFSFNTTDCIVLAGNSDYGTQIYFNEFTDPVPRPIVPLEVTSIDTVANTMTVTDTFNELGTSTGAGFPKVMNINPNTVTMPGGVNLPGVGGSNDYSCYLTAVVGLSKTVQFPVDITSVGSGVWINREQGHADFIQYIPGPGGTSKGGRIIGNKMFGKPDLTGVFPQEIFVEDIAGTGVPGYHEDMVIAANMLWGGNPYGVAIFNGRRCISAANTLVGPSNIALSLLPTNRFATQRTYDGRDNVMMNGVAYAHTTEYVSGGDLFTGNLNVAPAGYAASGKFTGTGGYNSANLTQFMAAFARTDLNGTIDYTARTYDLKEINTPNAFTVTNATGAALNAVVTHAVIPITSATKYPSGASAVGLFATVTSAAGALPELRVTSDAGGTTVVTNWTTAPVTVLAGQYLWVRGTASGVAATARIVSLRVGDRVQEWTITTA